MKLVKRCKYSKFIYLTLYLKKKYKEHTSYLKTLDFIYLYDYDFMYKNGPTNILATFIIFHTVTLS